ncbi:MAG: MinD/ParA family protein [Alphaproteobacteria bacterium]|nr:MinD/ParA family protein [Alphaproteobacteria bacterium]MDE2337113.1 MinD/ParA family protein [Alphaproteobacteria bacterium]
MATKTQNPETKSTASGAGRLIAVASGKGGVGKTWFSITLSHALAKEGKKVLLFDGDLGLANIDVQLGLMAKRDLNDVIEGHLGLAHVVEHYEEGGFDVVAGRSGHGSLSSLPLERLNALLREIRNIVPQYDAVIVDLGAGIDRTVRFITAATDATIVVTTDEPTALTDAYALIKLSHAAGHADNIKVVVNMTADAKEGTTTYNTLLKACKNFLKLSPPLLGVIRQDKRVREAIRAQTPYLTRSPNTDTAADIEKIARAVNEEIMA